MAESPAPAAGRPPQLFCGDIDIRIAGDGTLVPRGLPHRPAAAGQALRQRAQARGRRRLLARHPRSRRRASWWTTRPSSPWKLDASGEGEAQRLRFRTNLDEWVSVDAAHPLAFRAPARIAGEGALSHRARRPGGAGWRGPPTTRWWSSASNARSRAGRCSASGATACSSPSTRRREPRPGRADASRHPARHRAAGAGRARSAVGGGDRPGGAGAGSAGAGLAPPYPRGRRQPAAHGADHARRRARRGRRAGRRALGAAHPAGPSGWRATPARSASPGGPVPTPATARRRGPRCARPRRRSGCPHRRSRS